MREEYTANRCPDCKTFSLEQMDNFNAEFVATRYRCYYCGNDFAIHILNDEDVKKLSKTYGQQ